MASKILPSLMAKSQSELDLDLKKLKGVAKELHIDIVDGKFAPNKTFQFPFKLKKGFEYNLHLMVQDPEKWVEKVGDRVQTVIFHPEVLGGEEVEELIKKIKAKKKKVGLALKPETKVKEVKCFLKGLDYVLILTVHPGFYGAKFLKAPLKKIGEVKKINSKVKVIIDGGMNPQTIGLAAKARADLFVSGSFVTKTEDPKGRVKELEGSLKLVNTERIVGLQRWKIK